jgi:hypothetical protein
MPWSDVTPMDQRLQFVVDVQREVDTMCALCARYGISRKTGYKWLARYAAAGPSGLAARSHRPHTQPRATAPEAVAALLTLRQRHPTWGAKKLLAVLARRQPALAPELPARSTAALLLKRHGLITRPRRRRTPGHPGRPRTPMTEPNAVWTADFKGQFRLRDGAYCFPLTVADGASRYLLACRALTSVRLTEARPVFVHIFREYGLPERIRTDNGVPFATIALGRLSLLSVWWVRLGILPELIEPGRPAQNGRHGRPQAAHAPHAQGGGDAPVGGAPGGPAAALRPLPCGVQRGAAARGAGPVPAGRAVHALAAGLPGAAPPARVPRPLRSAAREPQRRHPLAQPLGEREPRARRGVRRLRGGRRRPLDRLLRAAHARALR